MQQLTGKVGEIEVPFSEAAYQKIRSNKVVSNYMGFKGRWYDLMLREVKALFDALVKEQSLTKKQLQALSAWHEKQSDFFFDAGLKNTSVLEAGVAEKAYLTEQELCFVLSTYHAEAWEAYDLVIDTLN